MSASLQCWKCGTTLEGVPLPLSRLSECLACHAELHVCRMCEFYAPRKAESCEEPRADPPLDKTRANFCEFFQPRAQAWQARDESAADQSRAALEALFRKQDEP